MRAEAFKIWMKNLGTMSDRPTGDAVSRCRRVEKGLNIDLDDVYAKDGGRSIISLLEYTTDDVRYNKPVPPGFIFKQGANLKDGIASLRAAAKKYFEFCQSN